MANGKSPGTDGLTPDFYKMFWGKLKHILYEVFVESIEQGELPLTTRYGILSLLEKAGKNGLNLKNWRPLTLLNTDNKIYSKMIANRMQEVMSNLINSDQTGFMKGRQMAENIMRIMQVIQYCQTHAQNAFLVSFDFEKAFDTI